MEISLEGVGKRYGKPWVFRDISTKFTSGKIYSLIGPNGSGKSTLAQIIAGFVTPNEGAIVHSLNGKAIEAEALFSHVAYASPYIELPSELTVAECIAFQGKMKPWQEKVTDQYVLEQTHLAEHKDKTIHQLSSGMLQRLRLGLALYCQSKLLILDEPCSNLDAKFQSWYNDCLASNCRDRLVIIGSNSDPKELELVTEKGVDLGEASSRG